MARTYRTSERSSRHAVRATRRRTVLQRVARDNAVAGLSPLAARAVFWFPAVGFAALVAVFAASRPLFYWVTQEDRPLEWIQFTLCLVTAALALAAAVRWGRLGRYGAAALMLVFFLGMIGLAGEEISWGQRVLGLATPEALAAANDQSETNIHNLDVGVELGDVFKVLEFLICVGAVGLSLLVRGNPSRPHPPTLRLLAPPLVTVPGFLMMAGYQAAQFLFIPDTWDAITRLQELAELGLYVGLAVLALICFTGPARHPSDRRPLTRADLRLPGIVLGTAALITVLFAVLSFFSGIDPGNIGTG